MFLGAQDKFFIFLSVDLRNCGKRELIYLLNCPVITWPAVEGDLKG